MSLSALFNAILRMGSYKLFSFRHAQAAYLKKNSVSIFFSTNSTDDLDCILFREC